MNFRCRPRLVVGLVAVLVLSFVAPVFAFSYTYPLSSTDIRDAYFIGRRNDEITSDFLLKYTRHLKTPSSGPYISDIGIDTPFSQIVVHASQAPNYDAPTAVQEFQDKPMNFFAHVVIYVGNDYTIPQINPPGSLYPSYRSFWQDFKIGMRKADDQVIRPLSEGGGFLYAYNGTDNTGPVGPIGARVDLEYAADKIDSDFITISVDAPDGQHVEATFDLAALR